MAANKERGEIELKVGDRSYVMKITTNALCEMETLSGRTYDQIMARIAKDGSLSDVRFMFWAALLPNHPEMTVLGVGDLIDEAGGIGAVTEQLNRLVTLNTEEALKTAAPVNGNGNPPLAQVGTGGNSTSMPVAPI